MFVLVKGIRSLVNGDMGKGEAIGMVAFGAVFATIPLGVIALMVIGAKRKKKAQSIRSAHRENPWLSKKEWVEGRIRSGPRAPVFSIWAFSLAFSGFCIPIILNFLSLDGDKGVAAVVFGGLFILAACGLLYVAIYMTIRWLKYGHSYFDFAANPGVGENTASRPVRAAASKGAHACCVGSPDAARPGKALSRATKSIPTCALCNLAQCPGQRYRTEHVALSLP